jgi:uncharacterized protein (UPF0264 family)
MGLAGMSRQSDWRTQLTTFYHQHRLRPVAVAYADMLNANGSKAIHPRLNDVLKWAVENQASGLLLDTTLKDGRHLFDFMDDLTLRELRQKTRAAGLFLALAGSLKGAALEIAIEHQPDIIAVRGAACVHGSRTATIDRERVRALVSLIEGRLAEMRQMRH